MTPTRNTNQTSSETHLSSRNRICPLYVAAVWSDCRIVFIESCIQQKNTLPLVNNNSLNIPKYVFIYEPQMKYPNSKLQLKDNVKN